MDTVFHPLPLEWPGPHVFGAPSPPRARAAPAAVICLKRIYNFLCSMLVFTPFAQCFVTLRGIFMHFPGLTY
jgi:hypothetical protein